MGPQLGKDPPNDALTWAHVVLWWIPGDILAWAHEVSLPMGSQGPIVPWSNHYRRDRMGPRIAKEPPNEDFTWAHSQGKDPPGDALTWAHVVLWWIPSDILAWAHEVSLPMGSQGPIVPWSNRYRGDRMGPRLVKELPDEDFTWAHSQGKDPPDDTLTWAHVVLWWFPSDILAWAHQVSLPMGSQGPVVPWSNHYR
jgi:hypothetical protein